MIAHTTPSPTSLFDPIRLGPYFLRNRIFMAPLTRGRALADGTPTGIMTAYYEQRASAGLIISEATAVSAKAVGWNLAPSIYTPRHVDAWKPITEAVHRAGGRIFMQLWHTGRASHPDFLGGVQPVAPSAIGIDGEIRTPNGKKPLVIPRALEIEEMPRIAEDFARAARRSLDAGFDGVEIHAANGYLLDQFLRDGSNRRTDEYGGSIEGRWRLPLEVTQAVIDEIGAARTGVRVSPTGTFNGMHDSDPVPSYAYGADQLSRLDVVYLHVVEGPPRQVLPQIRAAFDGVLVLNEGFDAASGDDALARGVGDAVAYGVPFLANPDLPARFRARTELNIPDPETFYAGASRGYTDYPALAG